MKGNSFVSRRIICRVGVLLAVLCLAAVFHAGCNSKELPSIEVKIFLSSTAFPEDGVIPDRYTCQGEDISPQLSWGDSFAGTKSLALIVDDLDTSGSKFTHWVIFNIPADVRELPEALFSQPELPDGALEGKNDFGKIGYGGPCPPSGKAHRYRFTVYALDIALNLDAGVSKAQVLNAVKDHVLAQGELIGTYQR